MRVLVSGFIVFMALVFAGPSDPANARGGYAAWLKHGDAYRVTGNFAGYKGSLQVQVKWRGNRFVVSTPLGTFPLQRAGGGVTFQVRFENAVAKVTWFQSSVSVLWQGQRGVASVRKIDSRVVIKSRGDTLK
jgi:hypothetical protein